MNHSSGTMREPRHRYRPSLALIIFELGQGGGGTRRAALSHKPRCNPWSGPNFLGRACKEFAALPCCAIG